MKLFFEFVREILWLAALGLCVWIFPKTTLIAQAVCAVGTIALVRVELGTG